MDAPQLKAALGNAALAFRGYNVTNLGRSRELLMCSAYRETITSTLDEASSASSKIVGREIDLAARVRGERETCLETYDEAIALILAMSSAQLRLLNEHFDVDYKIARVSLGYSLGEVAALVAGGVITMSDALIAPLSVARDCVKLADDVTLGILFSRGDQLPLDAVHQCCQEVNGTGEGVVGISAFLSPNSLLVMGQADTLDRLKACVRQKFSRKFSLRKHEGRWPPMHTPITWQAAIPNRSAFLMQSVPMKYQAPAPPVLSLVTGGIDYTESNLREMLHRWVDHPQRLWDAVNTLLSMRVDTVVHVGPAPNIIPATLQRLSDNVEAETKGSIRMRALSVAVHRRWLSKILPQRAALLRTPSIKQVILEDWLLDNAPG